MSYVNLRWNPEEPGPDAGRLRVNLARVPVEGEKWEFWNPDGSAAALHPDLDGMVFFVAEVTWVGWLAEGGPKAEAFVFLVPKSQYLADVG